MPGELEKKFRNRGLDPEDEPRLRNEILNTKDPAKLLSYIYIYGRSFDEQNQIVRICEHYISKPVPGLTANCMRVVIDYWGRHNQYYHMIEFYLDVDLLDEWYDEIIFSVSFVNRNWTMNMPLGVRKKFEEIIKDPQIVELDIL
jgi:hypothetical protein